MTEKAIQDDSNLNKLRVLTKSLRFQSIVTQHATDWEEINTPQGTAFIRGLLKIEEIAVADNYAAADTIFPMHQHPAHEIFIVYRGRMILDVDGEKITVNTNGKPYYFDARQKHGAYFPVETKYIAVTIPADKDWPEGG